MFNNQNTKELYKNADKFIKNRHKKVMRIFENSAKDISKLGMSFHHE